MKTQGAFDRDDNKTVLLHPVLSGRNMAKHGSDPALSYKIYVCFDRFYHLFRRQNSL